MHIGCSKRGNRQYLQLFDHYTVRKNGKSLSQNKYVTGIGYLDEFDDGKPDFLRRLKESVKQGTPIIAGIDEYFSDNAPIKRKPKEHIEMKNVGYFIFDALYDSLGVYDVMNQHKSRAKIKYDLNGITKLLLFGRCLDPKSKLATFEGDKNKYLFDIVASETKLSEVYRALDELDKKSVSIQKRIHKKISQSSIGRSNELTYYDVTNFYYEIEYNDEDGGLRRKGVSKENRPNPISQMGLFMDNNGIPISYKVFPGNHTDTTTLRPALDRTVYDFDMKRVIVVADRGLNSDKNIAHLLNVGNGYVFSKSIRRNKPEVRKWILDDSDYRDKNGKTPDKNSSWKVKSRIKERTVVDEYGKEHEIKEKQVVFWSKKHYLRELEQNKAFLEYADACIEHPDKLKDKQRGVQKFLKEQYVDPKTGEKLKKPKKLLEIDEKKITEWKELMGYYLICTSETAMSDSEVIEKYRGLSQIEDNFRIIKSNTDGRPVFVRTPEHINAHFLLCFMALVMYRVLQNLLKRHEKFEHNKNWIQGITVDKMQACLNEWRAGEYVTDEYLTNPPQEELKRLGDMLGLDVDLVRPTRQKLKEFKYQVDKSLISM